MARLRASAKWIGLALTVAALVLLVGSMWFNLTHWRSGAIVRIDAGVLRLTTTLVDDPLSRLSPERVPPEWQWSRRDGPLRVRWLPHTSIWAAGATSWRVFILPLWIPALMLGSLTGWSFWRWRRPQPGECPRCRYDLGGLSGPCPECGHKATPPRPEPID